MRIRLLILCLCACSAMFAANYENKNGGGSSNTFSAPITNNGGTVSITAADATHDGYLSSTYWSAFNSKPTFSGSKTTGDCVSLDASGNLVDSGGSCAGSPSPATINYTPTNGNTITQQVANMKVIQFCDDYGACDGSTDDTAAWNTAIAQANAHSIEMRIPNGKTVTLHDPTLPSNISVVCGAGATIKDSGSNNWSVLQIKFVHDVSIHHCHIDQNGAQQTNGVNVMIYAQGATNFTLDDVWLTNSGTPSPGTGGILIYASNGGDIGGLHIDHTILGTHVMINTYSPDQKSASAQTLFGSNDLDNLLLIQSAAPGTGGNSMTATIANDGASQALSFTGTSTALTIHLATNASSVSTSTAASIISAFQGNALQKYFRVTTYDTATGIVAAATAQTLSGGVDAYDRITLHDSVLDGSQSDGIHVEAAGNPAGTYCNVVVRDNTITNVWDWQDYLASSTAHSGQNGNGIDIDSCNGVVVENNTIDHVEFSGIRFYNTWDSTARGNTVRHAGEQSLYAEFNSQGNTFEDNHVFDSMFGTNDNNAEQRTALRLNRYIHNYYRNIQGTGIVCNACIAEGNTFEGVVEGVLLGGGGSGGYNSQIVNNRCVISSDTTLPGLLDCISYGASYGGTDALIQGNHTVGGTPTFGHIWGNGGSSGHITSVVLGNPTTIKYTDAATLASGNYVCPLGIEIHSTSELNGHCYVASSVDGSSFTIPIDSTGFRPWIAYQSLANPTKANGWRFPSFKYVGDLTTSPAAFNSHVLVRDERIKDAVKGTPQVGSHVTIINDDCSSGALTNAGSGAGADAHYTSTGWACQ